MIKQKTFIIIVDNSDRPNMPNRRLTTNDIEDKVNKRLDGFLEHIQKDGHTPFSVSVSSKDDIPIGHCFVATVMYRENATRKVITEKINNEKD